MILSLTLLAAVAVALALSAPAGEGDPVVGIFKLNVHKSQSSNGVTYVDGTIHAVDEGEGVLRMFYERVRSDGTRVTLRYTYRPDCVDCPVSGGPAGLTVSRTRIGKRTFRTVWKLNGKAISVSRNVYSGDFKVLTNTADNIDENDLHYKTVMVWERQ